MEILVQLLTAIHQWKFLKLAILSVLLILLAGCNNNLNNNNWRIGVQIMRDQPRYDPLEANPMFADGSSARPLVPGTVARGHLRVNDHIYTGRIDGKYAATFPMPVTRKTLERGQERFNIYCAPCHSRLGDGQGMIVQRGFKQPPSFHSDRLRAAPPGYFVDVMTNGFGAMFSYASRVNPEDRWAIAAYIRALQLSQHADLSVVPAADRQQLEEK